MSVSGIYFAIFGMVCAIEAAWMLSDQRKECMDAIYDDEEGLSQHLAKEIEIERRALFWIEWDGRRRAIDRVMQFGSSAGRAG